MVVCQLGSSHGGSGLLSTFRLQAGRIPHWAAQAAFSSAAVAALSGRLLLTVNRQIGRCAGARIVVDATDLARRDPADVTVSGGQSASAVSTSRSAPSAKAVLRSPLERRDAADAKMTAPITRAVWTPHGSGDGPSASVSGRGPGHGHGHFLGHGVPHQSSMISLTKADDEPPCASIGNC